MLEKYYPSGLGTQPATDDQQKRIIAVQAALELAKASLSSSGGQATSAKTEQEIKAVINLISPLADAIQEAVNK